MSPGGVVAQVPQLPDLREREPLRARDRRVEREVGAQAVGPYGWRQRGRRLQDFQKLRGAIVLRELLRHLLDVPELRQHFIELGGPDASPDDLDVSLRSSRRVAQFTPHDAYELRLGADPGARGSRLERGPRS